MISPKNTTDLGIRVLLWIGKTVPLPAPPWFAQALQRVEVTCEAEGSNGFHLTFALSRDTPVDYTGLLSGTLDPWNRVIIGVLMGARLEILIDGVITHQQFSPSDQPGKTNVTVMGLDVSKMMDLEQKHESYALHPSSVIVTRLLFGYAQYGIVPAVTSTVDLPSDLARRPQQAGETNLDCIKRLAHDSGFVFYVEPLTAGFNKAYFGPDVRLGEPQPALTANMGAASNVVSIQFNNDPLEAVGVTGNIHLPSPGGLKFPLPDMPLPLIPPLALKPTVRRRSVYLSEAASEDLPKALSLQRSWMRSGRDTVTCNGTLDAVRYGGVLKARRPVGVRGVGFSYDGLYWVKRVNHTIENGKYTQAFSLGREGLGALSPVVVP